LPQHVICSNCRKLLVIRDGSPARLTCPKCLGRVNNPHPFGAVERPAVMDAPRDSLLYESNALGTTPPPLPRRVIPVEHEVTGDLADTIRGIRLLGVLLGGGGLMALTRFGNGSMRLMGVVVTVLVAGLIIYWWQMDRDPDKPLFGATGGTTAVGTTAKGCFTYFLIILGVIALLVGLCTAALIGVSFLSTIPFLVVTV
jgi:hypothetical protein